SSRNIPWARSLHRAGSVPGTHRHGRRAGPVAARTAWPAGGRPSSRRRRMRLALGSTPFLAVPPRNYGETELVVYELAEGLVERGHDVTLFATGDSWTRADLRWLYPEHEWPPDSYTELNHVAWAMEIAEKGGYDVVHAHSASALAIGRLMPELPLVYT